MIRRPFDTHSEVLESGIECKWCRKSVSGTTNDLCNKCYPSELKEWWIRLRESFPSSVCCHKCKKALTRRELRNRYYYNTVHGPYHFDCGRVLSQSDKYREPESLAVMKMKKCIFGAW